MTLPFEYTKPIAILAAPLCDITRLPFRKIIDSLDYDLMFTEMISIEALIRHHKKTQALYYKENEQTRTSIQLMGGPYPDLFVRAVECIVSYGFYSIDINIGCPVSKVLRNDAGCGLMAYPDQIYQIYNRLTSLFPHLIFSGKIRLGLSQDKQNYLEVAHAIEAGGAKWVTVHGRTRTQKYEGPVNFEAMREVKSKLKIPVIGNGNLFTPQDVATMIQETQVDGVMLARGMVKNPWLAKQSKLFLQQKSYQERSIEDCYRILVEHFIYEKDFFEGQFFHEFKKIAMHYLNGIRGIKKNKISFVLSKNTGQMADEIIKIGQNLEEEYNISLENFFIQDECLYMNDLIYRYVVSDNSAFQRVDIFLAKQTQLSRNIIHQNIATLLINNQPKSKDYILQPQDEIYFAIQCLDKEKERHWEYSPYPIDILYEDDDLFVVLKPSGLLVHPGIGYCSDTLVGRVGYYLLQKGESQECFCPKTRIQGGLVHRLDKDTEGLLVIAKNLKTHALLAQQFMERKVLKIYYALGLGILKSKYQNIHLPIRRHPRHRTLFHVHPRGKIAQSEFETIKIYNQTYSLLKVRIHTGRTHQIRVHLQNQGISILGDIWYGNKRVHHFPYFCLISQKLGFFHPIKKEKMIFNIPLNHFISKWEKALEEKYQESIC